MNKFEIEYFVYSRMCYACPNAKRCHDECDTCEEFDNEVSKYFTNEKQCLIDKYLNKQVHVVIRDPWHPIDADGVVTLVDDACQLHGTWGGLAVVLPYDSISLLQEDK